jgi:hypothetical protein
MLSSSRKELSITRPIEYNYTSINKKEKVINNVVNIESFLNAKRKPSQNSVTYRMVDQDGCLTPKANQSFLINFNGIFDEQHKSSFIVVDEIWEKLKSKFILTLDEEEYVFNWFKQ